MWLTRHEAPPLDDIPSLEEYRQVNEPTGLVHIAGHGDVPTDTVDLVTPVPAPRLLRRDTPDVQTTAGRADLHIGVRYPGEDRPGSRVRPAPLIKALIDIETGNAVAEHEPEPIAYFGPGRRVVGTPGPRVGGASRPTIHSDRTLAVVTDPAGSAGQLTRQAAASPVCGGAATGRAVPRRATAPCDRQSLPTPLARRHDTSLPWSVR